MTIEIATIRVDGAKSLPDLSGIAKRDLWSNPQVAISARHNLLLVAKKGDRLVGYWFLPVQFDGEGIMIKRSCRAIPYCAPNIDSTSNLERRSVMLKMLRSLQERVHLISIPMAPSFNDGGAISAVGIFVELRHTHIFHRKDWAWSKYPQKTRNHIRSAEKKTVLHRSAEASQFDFKRALIASNETERHLRSELACRLVNLDLAFVIAASSGGRSVGGAFVAYDSGSAYLLHLWTDRENIRGISSLLIHHSVSIAFNELDCDYFDFEGSVLSAVDRFMCSFNASVTPYGYLHWHRDPMLLAKECLSSRDIPGRSGKE